jgi:TorA maturation chaperone TorD
MVHPSAVSDSETLSEEDMLRAQMYRFLARLLSAPPDSATLKAVSRLKGDDTDLGKALSTSALLAGKTSAAEAETEYNALFIGLGRGELVPYGSYYLAGFLNEKPLAKLRQHMKQLDMARADDVSEPEDHIASLCEMMAGMIDGVFGGESNLHGQQAFFDAHLASWAPQFFRDLEGAQLSKLYAPIGTIGRVFMTIESTAFKMVADES